MFAGLYRIIIFIIIFISLIAIGYLLMMGVFVFRLWLAPSCQFSSTGCGSPINTSKTVILEQPKTIYGLALGAGVKLQYESANGETFTAGDEREQNIREIFVDSHDNQNAPTIKWGEIQVTSLSISNDRLRILPDYRFIKEITAKQHEFFQWWQRYCPNMDQDSEGFGRIGILSIDLIDSENWKFNPDNFKYIDCDSYQFASDPQQQAAMKQFNQFLLNLRYKR